MLILIDDPADPRLAPFVAVRERDLVGRGGGFMAEGEVVLAAAAGRGLIDALLVDRKRVEGLEPIIARLDPQTPVYAASQAVLDAGGRLPYPQGVLAIGRRPPETPAAGALLAGLPTAGPDLGAVRHRQPRQHGRGCSATRRPSARGARSCWGPTAAIRL